MRWLRTRPAAGLPRYVATDLADQAAYGAGVYAGCARERMISKLLPAVSARAVEGLTRLGR